MAQKLLRKQYEADSAVHDSTKATWEMDAARAKKANQPHPRSRKSLSRRRLHHRRHPRGEAVLLRDNLRGLNEKRREKGSGLNGTSAHNPRHPRHLWPTRPAIIPMPVL